MTATQSPTRYVPAGAELVDAQGTDAAVYVYARNGEPCAIMYHGKARKADWHLRYATAERRAQAIANFIETRRHAAERAAQRRAERALPHSLQVGDVLYTSWGYEQTNVDFYQVTRLLGRTMVELRKIAADSEATGDMTGRCTARKDAFVGEPLRRRASAGNTVKIESYATASVWDGRPLSWSSYH